MPFILEISLLGSLVNMYFTNSLAVYRIKSVIRPEQRAYLAERIPHLRKYKPLPIADFWNDGELTSGCIAGGRSYFHINTRGDVEPCAFAHFAVDNIRDKRLLDVLHSPFFAQG